MAHRSDGLVQRRAAGTEGETVYQPDPEADDDADDKDKSSRLTLLEEVILIGLKDKEVFKIQGSL